MHVDYCKHLLDAAKLHLEAAEREEQQNRQKQELAMAQEAQRKAEEERKLQIEKRKREEEHRREKKKRKKKQREQPEEEEMEEGGQEEAELEPEPEEEEADHREAFAATGLEDSGEEGNNNNPRDTRKNHASSELARTRTRKLSIQPVQLLRSKNPKVPTEVGRAGIRKREFLILRAIEVETKHAQECNNNEGTVHKNFATNINLI